MTTAVADAAHLQGLASARSMIFAVDEALSAAA
jgi:hypothetical protein